ncbi:hypothetical protein C7Y66_25570 [Chroococcidiopsis sp. CCALA 051]|uniref:hypothetical protein n=1 Tax=Chroococcidiopsis sp. CCALA 051 TaxID=869949 RepID=UPI000D0E0947|nr:hypothetical protein [Chroococcidiopsis sp. CCALA 051]MBE9016312.1 hypothetical protein [Chroococcidiopsidales cyanobacterium LEGE 13417]PSM46356.1 hypothetical protein C7Y66_25570 [Chroococcidiopsis sp. CCALA 051]
MLHLILIAQFHGVPTKLPASLLSLPDSDRQLNLPVRQQQNKHKLQEQQLNLNQRKYQQRIREFEILPTSRIDCFPLFPPSSGFPPGVSPISCRRP